MGLAVETGKSEERTCGRCGQVVIAREFNTDHGPWWKLDRHKAPCGLWCMGGGCPGPEYKTGAHGKLGFTCPCGVTGEAS